MQSERLKQIRNKLGLSQAKFGSMLKIPQTTYANYESGKALIPDNLKSELMHLGINLNWLITGEGSMYLNDDNEKLQVEDHIIGYGLPPEINDVKETPTIKRIKKAGKIEESDMHKLHHIRNWIADMDNPDSMEGIDDEELEKLERAANSTTYIPFIDMSDYDPNDEIQVEHIFDALTYKENETFPIPLYMRSPYIDTRYAAARMNGNQMEPTINNQEIVIFNESTLNEDGIYAYVIEKELFIRRFSIDKLKKEITIISDNPKYPAKTYPMDQEGLQVLGKVVFWIHVE